MQSPSDQPNPSVPAAAKRQPLLNAPLVIVVLIAAMTGIHLLRTYLPEETDFRLLSQLAFVPARLTLQYDLKGVSSALRDLASLGPHGVAQAQQLQAFLGHGEPRLWTLLTYAMLHGDYTHLALNCFWLLAFGSAVAKRFGGWRFLLFFAATAIAGALAHWLVYPDGFEPVIGASASVSGAMAAAARFVFQPGALPGAPLPHSPALKLREILFDRRAMPFVVVWFVINLLTGVAAVPLGISEAGIAWEAHIGGFVSGLLLFGMLDPARSPRTNA